jgi:predicted alpha/beta superfamily hydrolase
MMDGQNVFDDSTSFAGEWGIDETLDSLHALGDPGAIVVAIDHGGSRRGDEYHPWPSARFGGGEGDRYLDFLALTLKPWIDARYRTIPGPDGSAIVGSSSGGLIAFHAFLRHPGVFGRIGAFSPAFVVSDSVFALARAARPPAGTRLYMLSGLKETVAGQPDDVFSGRQRRMVDTLLAAGWRAEDIRSVLPADGTHAEWFWRREFPAAYRWLFARDR